MSLSVVESFLSIQGEGKYQGRLALFLRLFGCNLSCLGFGVSLNSPKTGEILQGCDTIRAVYTKHFDATNFKNENELLNLIYQKTKHLLQRPIIVITGGEPLLHHKNEILIKTIENLIANKFDVHFETNATIKVDFSKYEIYKKCYFAMSVKLENSGVKKDQRIKKDAIKAIAQNSKDSFYKFVLKGSPSEAKEIEEILQICKVDVWCMPLGASKKELARNAKNVANFAIMNGFNYSERIHIRLWDKKEGV